MTSPSLEPHYDVVIVGGRPAGAALAARLAEHDVPTLVVDRARFPSEPAVPSCAILYPPAMAQLDALGIDEAEYGDASCVIESIAFEVIGRFGTTIDIVETQGRNYAQGIDRKHMDHALWRKLEAHASVTAIDGTAFLDVRRDDQGAVDGVEIRTADGRARTIGARVVVGADGRFSPVAQKVGAAVVEDFARTSTAHFATWTDLGGYEPGAPRASVHTTARGLDILFFPTTEGRTHVVTHQRADRYRAEGSVESHYLSMLRSFPVIERRIAAATRVTPVVGLKRIANRYREAFGPGWVLVGDALHHKDPVDGQGVYDALVGARLLAEALVTWHAGDRSFTEAMEAYHRDVRAETEAMFRATTKRLARELYDEPPTVVINTLMRWMMTDPGYQRAFMEYLCRVAPPDELLSPGVMGAAVLRGLGRDMGRLLPWRWGRARAS